MKQSVEIANMLFEEIVSSIDYPQEAEATVAGLKTEIVSDLQIGGKDLRRINANMARFLKANHDTLGQTPALRSQLIGAHAVIAVGALKEPLVRACSPSHWYVEAKANPAHHTTLSKSRQSIWHEVYDALPAHPIPHDGFDKYLSSVKKRPTVPEGLSPEAQGAFKILLLWSARVTSKRAYGIAQRYIETNPKALSIFSDIYDGSILPERIKEKHGDSASFGKTMMLLESAQILSRMYRSGLDELDEGYVYGFFSPNGIKLAYYLQESGKLQRD